MRRRQLLRAQTSKSQTGSLARRFNSGPVLPFNPASIPGCQLWLDAADSSSIALNSSSNVLAWIDKSGNGRDATATGTSTYLSGGGINFTGSSYFLNQTFTMNLSQRSIFIVMQETVYRANSGVIVFIPTPNTGDDSGSTSGMTSEIGFPNKLWFYGNFDSYRSMIGSTVTPLERAIYHDSMNGTVGSGYLNGSNATNVNAGYTAGTCSGYALGGRWQGGSMSASYRLNGVIYEILVYNSVLSTIQRQKVEGYLAHKWDLKSSLPSNHPYKSTAPTYEEPVFLPTLISGNQLWLDGADTSSMTFSGSRVTGWTDKSGKGFNVATSSGATAPVYNSTTKELQFVSGNSNSFTIPQGFGDALVGKTFSFFFIGRRTVNTTYVYFLSGATSGGNQNLFIGFLSNKMEIGEYGPYASADIPTFNSPDPMRLYYYDIQTSTTANLLMNGNSLLTTVAGDLFLTSFAQPELGRRYGGAVYHDFNLSEMVVFSPALSETQRQKVEGYLAHKWKIQSSLPANHPYKSIAPTGIPRSITIQSVSALFNTANSSYLSIPANAALTLGTNNHTIEFWMYQTSRNQYANPFNYGNTTQFATNNYYMDAGSTGLGLAIGNGSGNWALAISAGAAPSLNEWHHYAVVRNGTTFTFYLNGINRATATSSISIPAQGDVFRIGNSTTYPIAGYISNFRLVNGTAVYTSNFTPPTSPLTAIPNTQILIQGLVDRSPNAYAVTNNGNVSLSLLSPFV